MISPSPGLEPSLLLNAGTLTPQKEMVRKFYKDMWDYADVTLIPDIFHPDFTFRGSLGPVLVGHAQFCDYVRWVTDSLEGYTSDILALGEDGSSVFGKVRFHGVHRASMFGRPPSFKHVWWYGMPIFKFRDGKVEDLWVLGDVYGLLKRIDDGSDTPIEFRTA